LTITHRALISLALLGLAAATPAAQDPLLVTPGAYTLEFENDWVRVVRVRYGPREVLAPHLHTALSAAYVYLNDGGPILFKHVGLPYAAVTRPATKAGSFRVYKGLKEVHAVENPTDTPSEFLRVEFKTEAVDDASLRGKFFREAPRANISLSRVQFENAQIRISRLIAATGETLGHSGGSAVPALLVALTASRVEIEPARERSSRRLEPGQTAWLDATGQARIRAGGDGAAELLGFEFKTRPVPPTARR
jgi:hypothetical protein